MRWNHSVARDAIRTTMLATCKMPEISQGATGGCPSLLLVMAIFRALKKESLIHLSAGPQVFSIQFQIRQTHPKQPTMGVACFMLRNFDILFKNNLSKTFN